MRRFYLLLSAFFALLFIGSITVALTRGGGAGELQWELPAVKRTVMTFAYKAYGSPEALGGRLFLSKLVFANSGRGSVRNFQISYQIPGYVPWTTPDTPGELLPGQTLVKLFYPKFPAEVAKLASPAPATLEMKFSWENTPGKLQTRTLKQSFLLRGLNQVEYTSLPNTELLTWRDQFENVDLLAAMVTSEDPVVKAFAAEVSRYAGGTTAAVGNTVEEISRFMRALYDNQVECGFVYVTADSGRESRREGRGEVETLVQTIRLPRDVIQSGNGLCVELAILWSAVLKHVGIQSHLIILPGHAFVVAEAGDAELPIECTGIGGAGIGGVATFEQASQSAEKMWAALQETGRFMQVDASSVQQQGIEPPDLPPPDLLALRSPFRQRLNGGGQEPAAQPARPAERLVPIRRVPKEPRDSAQAKTNRLQVTKLPEGAGDLSRLKVGDVFSFGVPKDWQGEALDEPAWMLYEARSDRDSWLRVYHWPAGTSLGFNRMMEEINSRLDGISWTNTPTREVQVGRWKGEIDSAIWDEKDTRTLTAGLYIDLGTRGTVGIRIGVREENLGPEKTMDDFVAQGGQGLFAGIGDSNMRFMTLAILLLCLPLAAQVQPVNEDLEIVLNDVGDAALASKLEFSATGWREYQASEGSNQDLLKRDLIRSFSATQVEDVQLSLDDINRIATRHLTVRPYASYEGGGHFKVRVHPLWKSVSSNGAEWSFSLPQDLRQSSPQTIKIFLPPGASRAWLSEVSAGKRYLYYNLPESKGSGAAWLWAGGGFLGLLGTTVFRVKAGGPSPASGRRRSQVPKVLPAEQLAAPRKAQIAGPSAASAQATPTWARLLANVLGNWHFLLLAALGVWMLVQPDLMKNIHPHGGGIGGVLILIWSVPGGLCLLVAGAVCAFYATRHRH